ncbi:hypothetical protein C8R47DRAFT_1205333 [Mycena vitilis]|nr:hypothetical protein C8R47DRAFT_1205333 [Mycena vitilis]
MPPKRTQADTVQAEAPAKRARTEATAQFAKATVTPDSPLTDVEQEGDYMSHGTSQCTEVSPGGGASTQDVAESAVSDNGIPTAETTPSAADLLSVASPAQGVVNSTPAPVVLAVAQENSPIINTMLAVPTTLPPAAVEDPTIQLLIKAGMHPGAVGGLDPLLLKSLFKLIHPADGAPLPASSVPSTNTIESVNIVMDPVAKSGVADAAAGGAAVSGANNPGPAIAVVHSADDMAEKAKILADLSEAGVTVTRVSRWSVAELKRLYVLLMWGDDARRTYSIDRAPRDKEWGVPAAFDDPANTLCLAGTSFPLNFWIAGEIAYQWWVDSDGFPAARPAISIQPMKDNVPDFCKTLLQELCMPANSSTVAKGFGPSQIRASRWMNTRAANGQPAQTHEFKAVYDARKSLRDKSLLQQIHVGQLNVHDIVVLEVRVGRYPVKAEGAPDNKGKKRAMDRWQAFLDLQAIYKIKDAMAAVPSAAAVADFDI